MSRRNSGFTLLEVLVALLVFGLIAGAASRVASNYITGFERVRDNVLAGWLADNRINQLRLENALPPISESAEDQDYGPFRWRITTVVTGTAEPTMRRVEVIVAKYQNEQTEPFRVMSLSAFLGESS
ncbi:type II secretion system minor pseudopilin GspI [Marinobacter persicus]|uniref:Type II secretion system protein I n=1 Tax=Marinobacter persicus TaxID=930118 RepID=A0A2S6G540_9GAMM|nr:type II secretion system minor pseudopilin GspI [Marinobacter persicus]PPK50772.1 general secretion pathway protein I [Marinobacter persicus]PPK54224.1 general secretion pathway protein I [Marinobacter persicus]PPK57360.1 general secretion pathway protein I [Marinobacter persicus]